MLWTIFVILVVLWLLGPGAPCTMGNTQRRAHMRCSGAHGPPLRAPERAGGLRTTGSAHGVAAGAPPWCTSA